MSRSSVQRSEQTVPSSEALREAQLWLAKQTDAPAEVREILDHLAALLEATEKSESKAREQHSQLLIYLGLRPKSEKRRDSTPALGPTGGKRGRRKKTAKEKGQERRAQAARAQVLSHWHLNQAIKREQEEKRLDRMAALEEAKGPLSDAAPGGESPGSTPPLTPAGQRENNMDETSSRSDEETAEQLACERWIDALMARGELGNGADPVFESVQEAFTDGGDVVVDEEEVFCAAPASEGETLKKMTDHRVRYEFEVRVTRVVAEVEKRVVRTADGRRTVVSGTTDSLGPAGYAVTWSFLANLVSMVVQYAMPLNRLGRLLSTDVKRFSASGLSKMLRYVAMRLVPIYLYLFDSISDTDIIMGDDTSTRVLQFERHRDKAWSSPGQSAEHSNGPGAEPSQTDPPWLHYATPESATAHIAVNGEELETAIGQEIRFESVRKTDQQAKRALNTTVLAGRSEPNEPRSLVVFYRTHLGSFGNLVEILLGRRNPRHKKVTVQSDLAAVNLVTDPKIASRFEVEHVGCGSHARRPFVQHEHEDPTVCIGVINAFREVASHESILDFNGRNNENTLAVREHHSRPIWVMIRKWAEMATDSWSKDTKIGKAARYIIRHYNKLTAYLSNPKLSWTNNLSERLLRMEKLIQANAMFRTSLRGRFVIDILRTITQTAAAAQVPFREYLVDVLRAPEDEVKRHPERYTPYAWRRRRDEQRTDGAANSQLISDNDTHHVA